MKTDNDGMIVFCSFHVFQFDLAFIVACAKNCILVAEVHFVTKVQNVITTLRLTQAQLERSLPEILAAAILQQTSSVNDILTSRQIIALLVRNSRFFSQATVGY
jgi:hypothetical protein